MALHARTYAAEIRQQTTYPGVKTTSKLARESGTTSSSGRDIRTSEIRKGQFSALLRRIKCGYENADSGSIPSTARRWCRPNRVWLVHFTDSLWKSIRAAPSMRCHQIACLDGHPTSPLQCGSQENERGSERLYMRTGAVVRRDAIRETGGFNRPDLQDSDSQLALSDRSWGVQRSSIARFQSSRSRYFRDMSMWTELQLLTEKYC